MHGNVEKYALDFLGNGIFVASNKNNPNERLPSRLNLGGDVPHFLFRGTTYIPTQPDKLSRKQILLINRTLDPPASGREYAVNAAVKKLMAGALKAHFNGQACKVYEIGCGSFPIKLENNFDYHGIEFDPKCQDALAERGIVCTDWRDALNKSAEPSTEPVIALSVYAQHFFRLEEFVPRLQQLINEQGFYIGNTYITPEESKTRAREKEMRAALGKANLNAFIISDMDLSGHRNQFWIIAKPGKTNPHFDFVGTFERHLVKAHHKFHVISEERKTQEEAMPPPRYGFG